MNKGQLITYKQHLTVQTNPTTSVSILNRKNKFKIVDLEIDYDYTA